MIKPDKFLPLILISLLLLPITNANASLQPRIVGGAEATPGDWSFMSALMIKNVGVIIEGNAFIGAYMTGSNAKPFSGDLVDCQYGYEVCEDVQGKICLIQRKGPTPPSDSLDDVNLFVNKVANCESGGGIAAIIYNDVEGFFVGTLGSDANSAIPAVSIDNASGLELLNYIGQNVAFDYIDVPPISSFCGATYLGGKWVLTAAHCVEDVDAESLVVNVGGHDLIEDHANVIGVVKIISHLDFDHDTIANDIALLELESEPEGITPIAIADESQLLAAIEAGEQATALGRGQQDPLEPFSASFTPSVSKLFEVNLPLISNETCNDSISDFVLSLPRTVPDSAIITKEMMCAGQQQGGSGTCFGDSGGPLFIESEGELYLTGVTSWGIGCAQAELYDVYARVPLYKEDIEAIMNDEAGQFVQTSTSTGSDDSDDKTLFDVFGASNPWFYLILLLFPLGYRVKEKFKL